MLYKFIKRGFDLLSSLLALIILSPVFLIVCIGIKASSKGPLLYCSQRVGLNGKLFTVLKFRSMHVREAGAVESKVLVNSQRIFKFGSFLRKSKLDELPQLINILLGDMSVVGPRPYPENGVKRMYAGAYNVILSVKPGLACLDSLYDYAHGELFVTDEEQFVREVLPVRTELAKMYVENKGIGLDFYCILRTVQLIFQIIVQKKREFPYTKYEKKARETISTALKVH